MTPETPTPEGFSSPESVCDRMRLFIAIAGLLLIAATSRLWFGTPIFPPVPLLTWFNAWPCWCDWATAGLMMISLISMLAPRLRRDSALLAGLTFAGAFLFAALLNQQRLQPWAYDFCVLLLVMAFLPAGKAVPCLRLVVASIYMHSGFSKLDVTFLAPHGEAFLSVLTNAIGWDLASAPHGVRRMLVAILPVGEILVAVGFLVPKTVSVAKWVSVSMHVILLWILGPWGLGHQPGVLIWNAFFIIQNLVLFSSTPDAAFEGKSHVAEHRTSSRAPWAIGYALTAAVILLPFLEPLGWYDHWPSWAVYASRPERVRVYIAENRVQDLPLDLRKFAVDDPPADAAERFFAGEPALRRIRIDQWSLEALKAPVYPEDRFQIGVALALAERYDWGKDLRVEIDGYANRWTGERTKTVLQGEEQIREAAGRFVLNAFPRAGSRSP